MIRTTIRSERGLKSEMSGPGPGLKRASAYGGFTLLELILVVAIVAIIAAVALPHLTSAVERSKQRATVAQIRELGQALIMLQIDREGAASAGREVFDPQGLRDLNPETIRSLLEPTYLRHVKTTDAWSNPLRFSSKGQAGAMVVIASAGRDGEFELSYEPGAFDATDYDRDIVWSESTFLQWPAGSKDSRAR